MPPKPTCKVVKREGQGGARIHPKGCQVRTDVKADGSKITKDKAGQRKYKKTEDRDRHHIFVARSPNEPRSRWVELVYDTGAVFTVMNATNARKLGYPPERVQQLGWSVTIQGVTGDLPAMELDMSFYVRMRPDDWRWVSGRASVSRTPANQQLLGVSHIASLKSAYQVKFV